MQANGDDEKPKLPAATSALEAHANARRSSKPDLPDVRPTTAGREARLYLSRFHFRPPLNGIGRSMDAAARCLPASPFAPID